MKDDSGIALAMTIVAGMLVMSLSVLVLSGAQMQLPIARHDQDHESALHAAEAGVDDYILRLNANSNYWITNPDPANPAFTGWVPIPGQTTNESFRYTATTTAAGSTGVIYLTASGKARNVVRTVKVGLRKQGFLDYLYFTDYEIVDPALDPDCIPFRAEDYNVNTHAYGPSTCTFIYFTSNDKLNGPTHSNDALHLNGSPTFSAVDTYYNQTTSQNVANTLKFGGPGTWLGSGSPIARQGDPAAGPNMPFPATNSTVQAAADKSQGGAGCLYSGPTTIKLHYSGNVGQMDVTSTNTRTSGNATLNAGCGPANNLSLPANGVIYVRDVPASQGCVSNCFGDASITNAASAGGLAGQLTVATSNDVNITGSLTYHDDVVTAGVHQVNTNSKDVLGLIASNDVMVSHPVSNGSNGAGSLTNPTIEAAIVALRHSFYVENWSSGSPLGTLNINGSIAQEFRGAVGTFSGNSVQTGYAKAYTYDSRLRYLTPPFFINPVQSAWTHNSFNEMKPAF